MASFKFLMMVFIVIMASCVLCEASKSKSNHKRPLIGHRRKLKPKQQEEGFLQFIRRMATKHGSERVQSAFDALDARTLPEVIRIVVGEVDAQLVKDVLDMQAFAEKSNHTLLSIIERMNLGDHTVALEIFWIDDMLVKYGWWKRLRRRVLKNVDKYLSEFDIQPNIIDSPTEVYPSGLAPSDIVYTDTNEY